MHTHRDFLQLLLFASYCIISRWRQLQTIHLSTYQYIQIEVDQLSTQGSSKRSYLVVNHKINNLLSKNLLSTLITSTVPLSIQFSILSTSSGGFEELGFTKVDFKNIRRDQRVPVWHHATLTSSFPISKRKKKVNQIS